MNVHVAIGELHYYYYYCPSNRKHELHVCLLGLEG